MQILDEYHMFDDEIKIRIDTLNSWAVLTKQNTSVLVTEVPLP